MSELMVGYLMTNHGLDLSGSELRDQPLRQHDLWLLSRHAQCHELRTWHNDHVVATEPSMLTEAGIDACELCASPGSSDSSHGATTDPDRNRNHRDRDFETAEWEPMYSRITQARDTKRVSPVE